MQIAASQQISGDVGSSCC